MGIKPNKKYASVDIKHSLHVNVNEPIYSVNESRLKLIYRDCIKKANNLEAFLCSLGYFITFLVTILTSEFKPIFNNEKIAQFINSLFVILAIISFVITIVFLINWLCNIKKHNEKAFVDKFKDQ